MTGMQSFVPGRMKCLASLLLAIASSTAHSAVPHFASAAIGLKDSLPELLGRFSRELGKGKHDPWKDQDGAGTGRALQEEGWEEGDGRAVTGFFSTQAPTSAPRMGDFTNLNQLLSETVITLPNTDIQEMLLFQMLQLALRNLECSRLSVDDLKVTPDLRSQQEAGVSFEAINLSLQCEFDFEWAYIFLVGNGHAIVKVGNSSAAGAIDFFSDDFTRNPPNSSKLTRCTTDINILSLEFSGNIASEVFNMMEQLIVDVLNNLLNDISCGYLEEDGGEMINELLEMVYSYIKPFLSPVEDWRYNVSYPEATMVVPPDANVLSWNDESGYGQFMKEAMEELERVFGSLAPDVKVPNETLAFANGTRYPEGYDLGINVMLREYLLEDDRSFTFAGSDMGGLNESAILYSSHDQLTETNISLVELKLYGLDTFTNMEPFQKIGNFTLQHAFSWEYLYFEVTIQLSVKASSLDDSFLRDPERVDPYVEEIRATVGIEDIHTVIAIMVALDPDRLGELQLGSLLDVMTMVPCVLASLYQINMAGMNVAVGDIRTPSGEGLVSPGLDRLLKDGIDLGFFMFKGTILRAIPTLFESMVRDLVTELLDAAACPEFRVDDVDEFVDLRDLLLDSDEAAKAGASGENPYGDLTSRIYGIGRGMWEEVEEDGTVGLNSLVIEPFTEAISGVKGRFEIPGTLYNFTTDEENQLEFKELVNKFEFIVSNLRVDNLNTVVYPMAVIQPVNHPYLTQSTINMGPMKDAPITATISMLMSLDIEDSPLAMLNAVDVGVSVSSIELFVEALTMMSRNNFLGFRAENLLSASCWFSVITPPELNKRGYRVEGTRDQGVELRRLLAKISDLRLHINCVQCSPGLDSLPDMVDIFERTKVIPVLSYRIPLFVEEIAISEAMQVALDRWLVDAPHACPHRPEYNEKYQRSVYWETPEVTQMSIEASDTIYFTAIAAFELAFVLLVETHYPWELTTLAPLSGQENFVAPEGSNLFDWSNLTETFDSMANDVRGYLSDFRVDSVTGDEDLGINLIIRDFLGVDEGDTIDFVSLLGAEPIEVEVEGVVFLFHAIKVRGLDSITRFDVMKPIAPQTILNSMHVRYLEIDVAMSTGSLSSEQMIEFSLKLKDLNATVPLFAAIDMNILRATELGHFMMFDSVLPCFLSAAHDIHFPQILFTLGEISTPEFKGFLADSAEAVRKSMEEVFERYGERFLKALPILFDVTARTFINTFISDHILDKANCTHIKDFIIRNTAVGEVPYPFLGYVDFRDLLLEGDNATDLGGSGDTNYGDSIRAIIGPVQEEILWVDPYTGLSSLNGILGPLSELLSGEENTFIIPGELIPVIPSFNPEMGMLIANITFAFGDIRLENVNTIGAPLNLMMPVFMRPYHLRNSAGLGVGGTPFIVSIRFSIEIVQWDEEGKEIIGTTMNDMLIKLRMNDAVALFDFVAKVSEDNMIHFPMKDIFNPFCWLSLVPAPKLNEYGIKEEGEISYLSFTEVALSVAKLNMTVECVVCQSKGLQTLVDTMSQPEAVEALTEIANTALDGISSIVSGNLIQDQIDRAFNQVTHYCPHHPNYTTEDDFLDGILKYKPLDFSTSVEINSLVYILTGLIFSLIIGITVISTVVRWIVNRRHQKWLRTLPVQKVHIIQHLQDASDQLERELNQGTLAMVWTPEIPAWVRYLMPVVIIGNIAFFVSGHVSIAADVAMTLTVAGEAVPMDEFFSFSIMESVIQMWDAGAEEMAIFILTFSGVWPYVKQILSLLCWVLPTTRLSITTRGNVYLWLDILAKWSMIDIFVLLLYMIAFRVQATSPDVAFLPPDFFGLSFIIIPRWGIYANLIAQMISQISSHFIVHYHRTIVDKATRIYEARHAMIRTANTTEASIDHSGDSVRNKGRLCDGAFSRPHKGESSKLVSRQIASYGLVVGTFLLFLFITVGCSLEFMSVEIQGLMSYVSGEHVYKEFSVLNTAALLVEDGFTLGGFRNIAGYLLLGSVVVLTVFIVPLVQALALAFHWFRPMDDKQRKRSTVFIEILAAWQFAEVWILATLVAVWQQGKTSELVMYQQCEDFNELFRMISYYGLLEKEKAHCFRVEADVLNGTYFFMVGTILLAVSNSFVLKADFHHFWDKECVRKEDAMEERLTFEEAASPITNENFDKIRPPPVLFTDAFRWLLRQELLGELSMKVEPPLRGLVVEGLEDELDQVENLSFGSTGSWQQKCAEDSKSVDDTASRSLDEPGSKSVVVDRHAVEFEC